MRSSSMRTCRAFATVSAAKARTLSEGDVTAVTVGSAAVVRVATAEDAPALAEALARAFDDDPLAVFAQPRASSRPRRLTFFYRQRLRTLLPAELCFCDEERRGAALWAPYDRWEAPPSEQLRLVRMFNLRTPLTLVGFARMERNHPHEPHYYLGTLGVSPEAQGRGLGS